jgi:hypothetical protein
MSDGQNPIKLHLSQSKRVKPARMGKNRRAIPVENKFCGQWKAIDGSHL